MSMEPNALAAVAVARVAPWEPPDFGIGGLPAALPGVQRQWTKGRAALALESRQWWQLFDERYLPRVWLPRVGAGVGW